ncbi:MAG: hypothetical protein HeimC3_29770 [Candidatus Heimdallarchaeota archaeon LC_3]|nr:MAG: hypothetical protein HeimC3_29770 [Candidatus Heimdallarchaeota archaeon LC_3]
MKITHNAFNIGYRLGSLSRHLEIVIETANAKTSKEKYQIEVYRIYESLKYVLDELEDLNILEKVQYDLSSYLNQLTGLNSKETQNELKRSMVLSKFKKKISDHKLRTNRVLKPHEVSELDLKLKMWKDRITNEFVKS